MEDDDVQWNSKCQDRRKIGGGLERLAKDSRILKLNESLIEIIKIEMKSDCQNELFFCYRHILQECFCLQNLLQNVQDYTQSGKISRENLVRNLKKIGV